MIDNPLFWTLCGGSLVKFGILLSIHRKKPKNIECVGVVSAINLYPVKSMPSLPLEEAHVGYSGMQTADKQITDRHFMVTRDDGHFISMRQEPKLALVQISLHGNKIHLDSPGRSTLTVSLQPKGGTIMSCDVFGEFLEGQDCGDDAAAWLSEFIGRPLRLLHCGSKLKHRELKNMGTTKWHRLARPQDKVAYQDFAPYLLACEASLGDVNSRLEKKVDMRTFRPNITVAGSKAWDEDDWDIIFIGDAKLANLKPCDRCIMTTVDMDKGVKDPEQEPLNTLKKFRIKPEHNKNSPLFAINLFADILGTIRVGDKVYATRKSTSQ